MSEFEIPEEVIEAAAKAMFDDRIIELDQGLDNWEGLPDEWRYEWVDGARLAAPVIAAWAREQALAEAHEAVRSSIVSIGPEGPSDHIHEAMYNGGCDALRAVAALRGKEGEPNEQDSKDG